MPWVLDHLPASEEWEKRFATEAEAVAELAKHVCGMCLKGCLGVPECTSIDENGIVRPADGGPCRCGGKPVDVTSARELLSTPCGCEYDLYEETSH